MISEQEGQTVFGCPDTVSLFVMLQYIDPHVAQTIHTKLVILSLIIKTFLVCHLLNILFRELESWDCIQS